MIFIKRHRIEFLDDVIKLQDAIPELRSISALEVELLYSEFSETLWACWLTVNSYYIKKFKDWVIHETQPLPFEQGEKAMSRTNDQ